MTTPTEPANEPANEPARQQIPGGRDRPHREPASSQRQGFQAHPGWYFQRSGPAGYVDIQYPGLNDPGIAFPPDTWASIVASVSAGGETSASFRAAEAFHQGDKSLPSPAAAPSVDPATCEHHNFVAQIDVNRLVQSDNDPTATAYSADITINCDTCGEPFRWIGLTAGYSPEHPMVSVTGLRLVAPLAPQSAPDGFGLGGPGYTVRAYVAPDAP